MCAIMANVSTRVRLDVGDEGVAVVTLDGPDTLNAFTASVGRDLSAAYRRCDQDDTVRVVVLTGAGRAFCSGADLSPGNEPFAAPGEGFSASPVDPPAFRVRKLVVAAVNGPAIGIGFTLALQCDVLVVAEDAKLAIPQVRLGMLGDAHSHWTLRRVAGQAVAADLLLTGGSLTGREAAERGIVARALPAGDVLPEALALAREVAAHADPVAVALSKEILWSDLGAEETAAAETRAHLLLMTNAEHGDRPASGHVMP
jgi:enoyl-CoA hydratase/carnithine racemase